MKQKQGYFLLRIVLCFVLLLFFDLSSFGQQEDEKPTPLQNKVADEAQKIKDNTDWNDQEETRKAMIKIGKLMQELDREEGAAIEGGASIDSNAGFITPEIPDLGDIK